MPYRALLCFLALAAAGTASAEDGRLSKARDMILSLYPESCDADLATDFAGLENVAYDVSWQEKDWDGAPIKREGTLFEVNCYLAAYNIVVAYVFAPDEDAAEAMLPVSFAVPAFTLDYADDDTDQTRLAAPPAVTGFSAETLLVNPSFDPETNTITSFAKWRGLGDAYSSGAWALENGRFVLKHFVIDPIYEANVEDPSEELIETNFVLYDADAY
ncbi:DUF1176 domain-containing protein [Martelella lutilitoris]|nr:DUF1176 domain-containing protein [Martelella lutilitoris]